jgi:hypothetical protein
MFTPSDLSNFFGSENFYRYMGGAIFTDGIKFLMDNGAHWLCSDAMIACKMEPKLRGQEFISIKAKVKDSKAVVIYDDGNGNVLFRQKYDGTDLPCDLDFYFENGTMMLTSER